MSSDRQKSGKTRAQQVRENRQQGAARTSSTGRKPSGQTTATRRPPVVVGSSYNTAVRRQPAKTQPRRKVIYRVGANGVETRLPAIPIVKFSWRWISGLLAIVLLVSVLVLGTSDAFKVGNIEAAGLQRVTLSDLQSVVMANTGSIFTLNREKVLDAVSAAFPELKNIDMEVSLPNSIKILAQERQPILAWKTGKDVIWVDAEGVVMPVRGDAGSILTVKAFGTPPVMVPASSTDSDEEPAEETATDEPAAAAAGPAYFHPQILSAAIQLSAVMPKGATLVYDPAAGMGWRDPGGWRVYFGNDLSNIEFKKVEYQTIMDELTKRGIKPTMVSIENEDAPYFRID